MLLSYFGSPYGRAFLRCLSSRRDRMSASPRRFLRLRFLPRERLCRRPALPALIFPVPVMRNRFTALRFVFNFGMLPLADTNRELVAHHLWGTRIATSSLIMSPKGRAFYTVWRGT